MSAPACDTRPSPLEHSDGLWRTRANRASVSCTGAGTRWCIGCRARSTLASATNHNRRDRDRSARSTSPRAGCRSHTPQRCLRKEHIVKPGLSRSRCSVLRRARTFTCVAASDGTGRNPLHQRPDEGPIPRTSRTVCRGCRPSRIRRVCLRLAAETLPSSVARR